MTGPLAPPETSDAVSRFGLYTYGQFLSTYFFTVSELVAVWVAVPECRWVKSVQRGGRAEQGPALALLLLRVSVGVVRD